MKEGEETWPNQSKFTANIDESEHSVANVNVTNIKSPSIQIINWNNYSNWNKLVQHVTWLLKLKSNWLHWKRTHTERENFSSLTVKEMKAAKLELYCLAQMESFPVEYENLQTGKQLPNRSKIKPLRPVMDDDLIRVGGRIGLAHTT